MKYYHFSIDADVAGKREYVDLFKYDIDLPTAQGQLDSKALPNTPPIFSQLDIDQATPFLQDIGTIGGEGFLAKKQITDILNRFSLGKHKIYQLETFDLNLKPIDPYCWVQVVSPEYSDWIDYRKSSIWTYDSMGWDLEKIDQLSIKSSHKFRKVQTELLNTDIGLLYEELTLNKRFPNLDIFYMNNFQHKLFNDLIVSERLMNFLDDRAAGTLIFSELPIHAH